MKKGLFIVVDGGDGAGKGTQVARAKKHFGDLVVTTREPGGSFYAEEIRHLILGSKYAVQADAKTMFQLFWAARADHLKNTIRPALEAGKTVICDRFDSSTFAYQIFGQGARDLEPFFWQTRDFILADTKPDLYIHFDIDPLVGLKRKAGQGAEERNHFEDRKIEFSTAMQVGFREFMQHVTHEVVDAGMSEGAVWDDFQDILQDEMRANEK